MTKNAVIAACALPVLVVSATSYYFLVYRHQNVQASFVNRCKANTNSEAICNCTFHAFNQIGPPYANLLKSSVHDAPTVYRKNASKLLTAQISYAAVDVNAEDLHKFVAMYQEKKSISNLFSATIKLLRKHSVKVIPGVSQIAMLWRSKKVMWETSVAGWVYYRHCGGIK